MLNLPILPIVAVLHFELLPVALAVVLALELASVPVVLAHALGRHAFARLARLPIGRPELRIFVRVAGSDRTAARLGALAAGTSAAYLGVAALAFAFATCQGLPTGHIDIVVADLMDGYDAVGKLQPGDRILAVDGEPLLVGETPSLAERVRAKEGAAVTLTIRRAVALLDVTIQPRRGPSGRGEAPVWLLGLRPRLVPEHATDAAMAAAFAIRFPIAQLRGLAEEIASRFAAADEPDPGGPMRIVEEFRREPSLAGASGVAWPYALSTALFALVVLALLDVAGAAAIVRARRRRRRAA